MAKKGKIRTANQSAAGYTPHPAGHRKKSIEPIAAAKNKKYREAAAQRKASIKATEELMSDPEIVESLERSEADLKAGRMKSWSQVKSEL